MRPRVTLLYFTYSRPGGESRLRVPGGERECGLSGNVCGRPGEAAAASAAIPSSGGEDRLSSHGTVGALTGDSGGPTVKMPRSIVA